MKQRRALVTAIVATGVFLASLDLFIVNIAFPDIARDFEGSSLSEMSWILNAYAIVFAALLVPAGRWADRAGRKRGFLYGLALFTLASAVSAAAPTLEVLVAARVLQAAGAALMVPDVARPAYSGVPRRAPRRGRRALGRRGRRRGCGRPADRRGARGGELALGLPDQHPDRPRRARRRRAHAARDPRPVRRAPRTCSAPCCSRSASARSPARSSRARTGAGATRRGRRAVRGRGDPGGRRGGPLAQSSRAGRRARARPHPLDRVRQPRGDAVLRRLRRAAARQRPVPHRAFGASPRSARA